MFRPVFVPKYVRSYNFPRLNANIGLCRRGRVTVEEREKEAQDSEQAFERKRLEEEERRKQSHDMVAESIKRELAESTSLTL